jgi:hypothetical protein
MSILDTGLLQTLVSAAAARRAEVRSSPLLLVGVPLRSKGVFGAPAIAVAVLTD